MKYSAMLVKAEEAAYNPKVSFSGTKEATEATTESGLIRSRLDLKSFSSLVLQVNVQWKHCKTYLADKRVILFKVACNERLKTHSL